MTHTPPPLIAVLGTGSWGTALALLLQRNGNRVNLWGHDQASTAQLASSRRSPYLANVILPTNIVVTSVLEHAVANADSLFLATPSDAIRPTVERLRPVLSSTQSICLASKGLEPHTGQLLNRVISDILGEQHPLAILSGPSFAKEVAHDMITAVTIATTDLALGKNLQHLLQNPQFRIYLNQDLIGVQIGGAVKNVLAIAAGIGEGLGLGANARAALITRGLAEMIRLGEAIGANYETLIGLAGLGDLILTCCDNQSRNRRFGLALGQGADIATALATVGQVVEGLRNSQEIYHLAQHHNVDMPIITQIYRVLSTQISPQEGLSALMTRANNEE